MDESIDWIATTRSGSTYSRRGGRVFQDKYHEYFHNATLKAVDRNILKDQEDPWGYLRGLPEIDVPELGKALYIWSLGDSGWQISTEVVKIEFPAVDNSKEV